MKLSAAFWTLEAKKNTEIKRKWFKVEMQSSFKELIN